jgi:hypothetical protein
VKVHGILEFRISNCQIFVAFVVDEHVFLSKKGKTMSNQMSHPCDSLLQQWQSKRETANFYFTALLRLSPDSSDALRRRQELNDKVFEALLAWRHIDDQLQSCYQEYGERT